MEIHIFYNLQLFYWHFLEILWLFIFLVFYSLWLRIYPVKISCQEEILNHKAHRPPAGFHHSFQGYPVTPCEWMWHTVWHSLKLYSLCQTVSPRHSLSLSIHHQLGKDCKVVDERSGVHGGSSSTEDFHRVKDYTTQDLSLLPHSLHHRINLGGG